VALIKCSECGKEISDKVDTCIHCGSPKKKLENKNKNNVIIHNYKNQGYVVCPKVKVFKENVLIGELEVDKTYKFCILEDCTLDFKCSIRKARVEISKNVINEINLEFDSFSGKLKPTIKYIDMKDSYKDKLLCPECGKSFKNGKCLNCGYEEKSNCDDGNNVDNIPVNNSLNRGNSSFIMITLKTFVMGLLLWGVINYFTVGDFFGYFSSKGKIIDTTWQTKFGELTFLKGGKCELYNMGYMETCTWKLDGKNVTVKYTYKNLSNEIKGKFNENFTRFEYDIN